MKLNLTNVLNSIAVENTSEAILRDPHASWNINSEEELKNNYEYYKMDIEMENDSAWEMIEWLDKNGYDYSRWKIQPILSYEEWLANENKTRANYMTTHAGESTCPFVYLVAPNAYSKMINLVNANHHDAINTFAKILAA